MNFYDFVAALIICAILTFLMLYCLVLAYDLEPDKFLDHAFLFFTLQGLPLSEHTEFGGTPLLEKVAAGAAEMIGVVLGQLLSFVAEMIGVALGQLLSFVMEVFLTPKLFFLLILAIFVKLLLGFIYNREEMKEMVQSCFEQLAIALVPIREGIQVVFETISNPWKLIGYAILILIIQITLILIMPL